ncbi:PREDICTED: outer envelope membrane protein 7 [Tarenaya hassleriana]|uniref:outer envelope membrane protein 7 n=1 Tax=Tarenaya hassleriana TaxID=28532 RepID=UPI00053C0A24|nr:PREDICTED: outer envelope membrane protein 7 [Tarenaya hassleriana]
MAAITTAVIAIAGVILGWITIEIACKPCLERGREAIDQSLNPDYDPDDDSSAVRAPLLANPQPEHSDPSDAAGDGSSSDPSTAIKSI